MLVMRTTENPAYPIRKLVGSKQPVWLDDLALAVYPLRLYGVQPRTPLRKKATHDPHPSFASALLDFSVVSSQPAPDLPGDMPARVVPDEEQNLLADLFELLQAPLKELGRYGTDGPSLNEAQPRIADLRQVESVAGDGFRLGVVFGHRLLDEAQRLSLLGEAAEGRQGHTAPPAFVQETHRPDIGIGRGHAHQPIAPSFFLPYRGSGEVIQRLARCHLTPRRRARVVRMVSPETRLRVSHSSKLACAAISKVQRLVSYPNSLGQRWSISLRASALSSSKTSRVLLGRE